MIRSRFMAIKLDYSVIWYRIWATYLILFIVGIVLILIEKPWKKPIKFVKLIPGLLAIIFALLFGIEAYSRIEKPDGFSTYTGAFIEEYHDARESPPLGYMWSYCFWDGVDKKPIFHMDSLSKKHIFPEDFIEGETYTVYYDKSTEDILGIEKISK